MPRELTRGGPVLAPSSPGIAAPKVSSPFTAMRHTLISIFANSPLLIKPAAARHVSSGSETFQPRHLKADGGSDICRCAAGSAASQTVPLSEARCFLQLKSHLVITSNVTPVERIRAKLRDHNLGAVHWPEPLSNAPEWMRLATQKCGMLSAPCSRRLVCELNEPGIRVANMYAGN